MTESNTPSKLAQWWAKMMNWLGQPYPKPTAAKPPTSSEYAEMNWADDGGAIPPPDETHTKP